MNPLVVVVPSRTASNLAVSLPAVRRHEPEARIIVVADGDLRGKDKFVLWKMLQEFRDLTAITEGEDPFIFARNVNIGLRAACDDSDVVVLNDDAILESPHGFSIMQAAAAQDERIGIIGAVTDLTGQPLQCRKRSLNAETAARQNPSIGVRAVEHIAFVAVLIPARTRKYLDAFHEWTCPRYQGGTGECNCVARNAKGGWLDEDFCVDYGVEDRSYCEWVRRTTLLCCVHDGCFVNHSQLHSSFRGNPTAPGSFQENLKIFNRKWGLNLGR